MERKLVSYIYSYIYYFWCSSFFPKIQISTWYHFLLLWKKLPLAFLNSVDPLSMNSLRYFLSINVFIYFSMVSCPGLCCRALLCFPQDFKKSLLHKEPGYWCLGEHGERSVCRRKKLCPEKTTARGARGPAEIETHGSRNWEQRWCKLSFFWRGSNPKFLPWRTHLQASHLDVRGKVTSETWSFWGHSGYTKDKFNSTWQVLLSV